MEFNWKLSSITNNQKRKISTCLTVKAFVSSTEVGGIHICDVDMIQLCLVLLVVW